MERGGSAGRKSTGMGSARAGILERWVRSRTRVMEFFSVSAPGSRTDSANAAAHEDMHGSVDEEKNASGRMNNGENLGEHIRAVNVEEQEHSLLRSRSKSQAETRAELDDVSSSSPTHSSATGMHVEEKKQPRESSGPVYVEDLSSPTGSQHRLKSSVATPLVTDHEFKTQPYTRTESTHATELQKNSSSHEHVSSPNGADAQNHDRAVRDNGQVAVGQNHIDARTKESPSVLMDSERGETNHLHAEKRIEQMNSDDTYESDPQNPLFTAKEAVYLVQTMSKYTDLAQMRRHLVPRTLAAVEQRERTRKEALDRSGSMGNLTSEDEMLYQSELAAIHALREFADLVVWADRHSASEIWNALELVDVMPTVALCLLVGSRNIIMQVFQALAISVQSVRETASLVRLFHSFDVTTSIIMCEFEERDEDILLIYLSCMKTIVQRLSGDTSALLRFFFNEETKEMPIYSYSLRFYDHQDGIVRTAVRNITLCVFGLPVPELCDLIVSQSEDRRHYFRRFARYVASIASMTRKLYAKYRLHTLGHERVSKSGEEPANRQKDNKANRNGKHSDADGGSDQNGKSGQVTADEKSSLFDSAYEKEKRRLRNLFYDHVSELSNMFEYANEIMRVNREKLAPCLGAILVDDFFRGIISVVARKGPLCQGSPSTQAQVASAALVFGIALQRITDQLLSQVLALETLAPRGQHRSSKTFCQGLKVFTAICEDETSLLIALNCFVFLLRERIVSLDDLYSQGLMMTAGSRDFLLEDVSNLTARPEDSSEPVISFEPLCDEPTRARYEGLAVLSTPRGKDLHNDEESAKRRSFDSFSGSRSSSRARLNQSTSQAYLYDFDPHDLLWVGTPRSTPHSQMLGQTASLNSRLAQLPSMVLKPSLSEEGGGEVTPQQQSNTPAGGLPSSSAENKDVSSSDQLEDAPLEEVLYTLFFYSHKLKSIRVFANAAFLLFALASKGPLEIDFVNVAASIMNDISKRISTDLFDRDNVTDAMIHHVHDLFYQAALLHADLSGFSEYLELSTLDLLESDVDAALRDSPLTLDLQNGPHPMESDGSDDSEGKAPFHFNPYDAYAIVILMHLIDKLTAKVDLMGSLSPSPMPRTNLRATQRICSVDHLREMFQAGVNVSVEQKEKLLLNLFALSNTYQYGRFDE